MPSKRLFYTIAVMVILCAPVFAVDTFIKAYEDKTPCSFFDNLFGKCDDSSILFGQANISCSSITGSNQDLCNITVTYNVMNNFTQNESEPNFNGNWSYLTNKPNNTFNSTYDNYPSLWYPLINPYNFINITFNSSYDSWIYWSYNKSNPYGFYNITNFPFYNNVSLSDVNTTNYYQIKTNFDNNFTSIVRNDTTTIWNITTNESKFENNYTINQFVFNNSKYANISVNLSSYAGNPHLNMSGNNITTNGMIVFYNNSGMTKSSCIYSNATYKLIISTSC
jgi:hypothetical protein